MCKIAVCQVEITGMFYLIGDLEIGNEDMRNTFSDLIKTSPFLGFPIQILMCQRIYEIKKEGSKESIQ